MADRNTIKDEKDGREAGDGAQRGMKGKRRIDRFGSSNHAEKGAYSEKGK